MVYTMKFKKQNKTKKTQQAVQVKTTVCCHMLKILQLPPKRAPIKFLEQLNFNFQNHCNGKQHVNGEKWHF